MFGFFTLAAAALAPEAGLLFMVLEVWGFRVE
jgi:hypothetical protein